MTKTTILITDAVGLVGAFIINELINMISYNEKYLTKVEIRAGYHTDLELENGLKSNIYAFIKPVLVKWNDIDSHRQALSGVDTLFLLTPFTSQLFEQRKQWIDLAITLGIKHILHCGVYHADLPDDQLPPHEVWNRHVEQYLGEHDSGDVITYTLVRINFDGYNGVVSPQGNISYFLPTDLKCGWIAREDIAAVCARILLHPETHHTKVYPLSAESLSLDDMAQIASEVCNKTIESASKTSDEFLTLALSPMANPDNDSGYIEYMKSVGHMFKCLSEETKSSGIYKHKLEIYPDIVRQICNRPYLTFKNWLKNSPHKNKLLK